MPLSLCLADHHHVSCVWVCACRLGMFSRSTLSFLRFFLRSRKRWTTILVMLLLAFILFLSSSLIHSKCRLFIGCRPFHSLSKISCPSTTTTTNRPRTQTQTHTQAGVIFCFFEFRFRQEDGKSKVITFKCFLFNYDVRTRREGGEK